MDEIELATTIRECLRAGAWHVVFEKADGTLREMTCTTKHDLIAEACGRDYTPGPLVESETPHQTLVNVFDLDIAQWRSFHSSSVKSFEPFVDADGNHIVETL